ncbi:helix-turn-helix transcriptional regulator [Caballeronia sp. LZ043]|uniref:AraC family transcriptional regulator n=1 Tax=Caballeronia sp. LZ043 TaxID=3038569 RepID=UPI00285CF980|nr:helix-turn-helix transcriptional regulator [Caballeronia sp. LZ043]MDR5826208.1 helix-turn-helix transcriptional regulator [Caballeronia sp. LZ043]
MKIESLVHNFDRCPLAVLAVGVRVKVADHKSEVPVHQHHPSQLVLALKGGVTCEVANSIWMVPPNCAVWVPGGMPHSIHATANARMCYLYVQPSAAGLPSDCCTLSVTPLVRELILRMADVEPDYDMDSPTGRLATVMIEELARMRIERTHLPTSREPRLQRIAKLLADNPADRRTLTEWGNFVAMSERSLARLVQKETGMTFGRWRQQLHLIVALRQLSCGATVQRVASDLGYESVTAFITMFKKSLGKPPAKYLASLSLPG